MQSNTTYIRVAIILIAGILALFAFVTSYNKSTVEEEKPIIGVEIGDTKFSTLIADIPQLRQLGLSGRPALGKNEGMLFIFDESKVRHFWMKEMNFPLDIVWIDENKTVAGISRNILPESYPETFSSVVPVQYVLEIKPNTSEEKGIMVGEKVEFIY